MKPLVLALLLAGCATPPPPAAVCPTVLDLPPQTQALIANEADELPPAGLVLNLVLPDYVRMRDEARAICGTERMQAGE